MDHGSRRAIIAAFLANLGIALAKFGAFAITGAASMLAEAIHSVADTGNQGLLMLGGVRSQRPADAVHNFGYSSAQARLSLNGGTIDGGDARFSISGGFTPALIAGVGQRYDVVFDDTGATQDSTYTATLTFASADEALPGAEPQPDLTVSLFAHTVSGATSVPGAGTMPLRTQMLPGSPSGCRWPSSSRIRSSTPGNGPPMPVPPASRSSPAASRVPETKLSSDAP